MTVASGVGVSYAAAKEGDTTSNYKSHELQQNMLIAGL